MAQATTLLGFPIMKALRDQLITRTKGMGDQGNDPLVTLTAHLDSNVRDQIRIHSILKGQEERVSTTNYSTKDRAMIAGTIACFRGDREGERSISAAWDLLGEVKAALDDDLALGSGFGNVSCQLADYDLICIQGGPDTGLWCAMVDFQVSVTGRIVGSP